jgi:hypothetical protein
MKIGVISSKSRTAEIFEDFEFVFSCIDSVVNSSNLHRVFAKLEKRPFICSGGGKGPETIAINYAEEKGFDYERVPPIKVNVYGAQHAFTERNAKIITNSDVLIAFWAGQDANIPYALRECVAQQKPAFVFPI